MCAIHLIPHEMENVAMHSLTCLSLEQLMIQHCQSFSTSKFLLWRANKDLLPAIRLFPAICSVISFPEDSLTCCHKTTAGPAPPVPLR